MSSSSTEMPLPLESAPCDSHCGCAERRPRSPHVHVRRLAPPHPPRISPPVHVSSAAGLTHPARPKPKTDGPWAPPGLHARGKPRAQPPSSLGIRPGSSLQLDLRPSAPPRCELPPRVWVLRSKATFPTGNYWFLERKKLGCLHGLGPSHSHSAPTDTRCAMLFKFTGRGRRGAQ